MEGAEISFRWKPNFLAGLIGSSGCGKTRFCLQFIHQMDEIMEKPVRAVLYIYNIYQTIFTDFKKAHPFVRFTDDLFELDVLKESTEPVLVILDDQWQKISTKNSREQKLVEKMAILGCHHLNVSMLIHLHTPFFDGGVAISRNINVLVMWKNYRDSSYISVINKQTHNGRRTLIEAYNHAVKRWKPLIVFLFPSIEFSFCTNSLVPNGETEVYI